MGISIVGTTHGDATTTINKPAGTAQNDVMVMFVLCEQATGAPAPPSGWTTVTTYKATAGSGAYLGIFRLVAGASEPASYTWTAGTASGFNAGSIVTLSGEDTTTPIDAFSSGVTGTSGTLSIPAMTASVAGDELLVFVWDWNGIGVSTYPLSGSSLYVDTTSGDQEAGSASVAASGSTGTLSVVFNSGSSYLGALAVLVKNTGSSANSLATKARSHFLSRAGLMTPDRAHFLSRAVLQGQARDKFLTAAKLQGQARDHFISRAALSSTLRSKFVSRAGLSTTTRNHFLVGGLHVLGTVLRSRFQTRSTLSTINRAHFQSRIASLKSLARARFQTRISALASLTRNHYLVSTLHGMATVMRSHFLSRAGMTTTSRSHFATRIRLGTLARSRFWSRFSLGSRARARFLTRMASLATVTRSRFVTRMALVARAVNHFLVSGIVIIRPFYVSAIATTQLLKSVFTALQALGSSFSLKPALSASFVRQPAVANPNSTIQVTATLTDIVGNPVTNASAVAVVVTFPDGSTSSFSLSSGVTNAGSGKYTLQYKTKGPGICLEDWSFTAADGTTTSEYHNTTPVEF